MLKRSHELGVTAMHGFERIDKIYNNIDCGFGVGHCLPEAAYEFDRHLKLRQHSSSSKRYSLHIDIIL